MEKHSTKTKITWIAPSKKVIAISVILHQQVFPVLVFEENPHNWELGDTVAISDDAEVKERRTSDNKRYYVFEHGNRNFDVLPEFYNAKVVYESKSREYLAVSVYVKGLSNSVLAFILRKEGQKVGDYIDIATNQKVVQVKREDGSHFFF